MFGMRSVNSSRLTLPRPRGRSVSAMDRALVGLICAFGMTASSRAPAGGGAIFSDEMPVGSTLKRIEIYADTRVNGIRLMIISGAALARQRIGRPQYIHPVCR
jgi:hypothetical protein